MTAELPQLVLPEPAAIRDRLATLDDEARFLRRLLRLVSRKPRDGRRRPVAEPAGRKAVTGAC